MKLHLPIALLTAVICAASAYGAVNYTYNGASTPDSADFGAGIYNGHIEATFEGNYTSSTSYGGQKGGIGAIPTSLKDAQGKDVNAAASTHVILTGAGTTATYIAGGGWMGYAVTGDKSVTVKDGAFGGYIYGGQAFKGSEGSTITGPSLTDDKYWQPKDEDKKSSINITLDNGAATQIYGGWAWGSTAIPTQWEAALAKYGDEKAREYALDNPIWAVNEKIVINVLNGSKLGYKNYDESYNLSQDFPAIIGGGYTGASVNNSVTINVSGENTVVDGAIIAGSDGTGDLSKYPVSFVNSTNVTISNGAKVTGDIYGGGYGDNAIVKNGTEIILNSGTVEGNIYAAGAGGAKVYGNTKVSIVGDNNEIADSSIISGIGANGSVSDVAGDRILGFDGTNNATIEKFLGQSQGFNAVEFKDVADIDFDDKKFNRFDTLYVAGSNPNKPTVVTTDAGREFRKIHVQEGGQLDMGNAKGETSKYILTGTGVALEEALVVDGTMNVDNAHLVIQGTNSQLGIGYNSNNAVMNVVNSTVDMTGTSTVHMGYYNGKGGTLNIEKGSKFIGGANNAWLGGGEINVVGGSSMEVCSTPQQYNYRTILGMSGNTLNLNIKDHSSFTSKATQFITNYNSDTTVNITVDGEGSILYQAGKTESKGSSYVIGTSGEWVTEEITKSDGTTTTVWRDKDTKGSVAGANKDKQGNPLPSDTITYIASAGTNAAGELYGTVNNAHTTITAKNGGKVQIDSARTYVGDVRDHATYGKDLNKSATFNVGAGSSLSFKDVEVYANTVVNNNGGTFKAGNMNINNGGQLTFNVSTASAVMTAEKLTVYTGGKLSFVKPAAAEGTSLAMEAPATTTVTLDSELVLLAGSTLVLDPGMLVNLGYNDLTIQDGATIVLSNAATTTLTMPDDQVVAMATTLFQTAGTFIALDAAGNIKADGIANVTFNGSPVAISSGNGVANVPEPTTATLSLLALAGLCARRRRK